MDEIVQSLRARIKDAIPAVEESVRGDVPFGYQPPRQEDEIRAFLNSTAEQRMTRFMEMGPDEYQKWSSGMMQKLSTRFGPAAQVLMPMLQGAPVEALAMGLPLPDDGSSLGVAAVDADLTELLGFNPFE